MLESTARSPRLSVVVPCFNEEEVLPETARRLGELLDSLGRAGLIDDEASSVFFIDDGSKDGTWSIIRDLCMGSRRFGGLQLSRNRGHQNALMAGLLAAPGDVLVSIDADLQDDLRAVEKMLVQAANGYDIVYGVRSARPLDTPMKRLTAQWYYRILHLLSIEIIYNHADFRLMSRRSIEALREYNESNLFLRALVPQLGFRSSIVEYERMERFAGESKYPLKKMIALAVEGITSFSTKPLRVVTVLGILVSAGSLALTVWAILASVVFDATVPGWASTVVPIYLICGVQLFCVGVIGEYVGKIYLETKRRPRSHVAEILKPHVPQASSDSWHPDADRSTPPMPRAPCP